MTQPSRPAGYAPGSAGPVAAGPVQPGGSVVPAPVDAAGDGFGETRFERAGSPYSPASGSAGVAAAGAPDQVTSAVPAIGASGPATGLGPSTGIPGAAGAAARSRASRVRGPRRARLQLRHISPFTVLKFCSVLAVALFFVWLITIGILYEALNGAGVIRDINNSVTKINGPGSTDPVTAGRVFAGATIIGLINIVLFIALSTVGSVVYNLCADLVGGIEVTLSERDA